MPHADTRRHSLAPLTCAIVLALGLPLNARATDAGADGTDADANGRRSKTLDTITVEGQRVQRVESPKQTEPLLEIPQTIVVIPKEVFSEQAQTSLRDVLRNTPGIAIQAGEGGGAPGDNIYVRGFGARNDVFVDGVRDPGVVSRDTFNVESVEIAKGSASTIAGRGSTGGAINLVTKSASLDAGGDARLTIGNANYARATADSNWVIGDSAALRVNAVWTDAGVPGRDVVRNRNRGVAASLGLGLGTPTRVYLDLMQMQQDNIPDYGLPGTLPASVAAGTTVDNLDWSNFYGLISRDHEDIDSTLATLIVEHDLGIGTLRNLSRFGRNDRDAVVTAPRAAAAYTSTGTPLSLNDPGFDPSIPQMRRTDVKYQDRNDRIIANQTTVVMDFGSDAAHHAIVAGVDLARESSTVHARADACIPSDGSVPSPSVCPGGRPPVTDLFSPNPHDAYTPAIYRTGAYTRAEADSIAAYLFDTLHLGERWELSAGLRRERFSVDYTSVAAPVPPATGGVATHFNRTDDMTSWRAGIVYKPDARTSLYAAAATAFSPSADGAQGLVLGDNSNGTIGPNSPALAPEKSRGYEAGVKRLFNGRRVLLTAALFRTDKLNAKTVDASGNTVLAGNQRVQGMEVDISGSLTETIALFGGYAWMDSTITDSGNSAEVDKALPYAPRQSLSLWATWQATPRWQFGAGTQYSDGVFFNSTNTTSNANQAVIQRHTRYWLFNAMASFVVNDRVTLQLNINNLTDQRYVERGYTGHFTPGASRSILAGIDYRF